MNPTQINSPNDSSPALSPTLHINGWTKKSGLGCCPLPMDDLVRRLARVTSLAGVPRDRLARRIRAGLAVSIPIADVAIASSFAECLAQAGAFVTLVRPGPVKTWPALQQTSPPHP